MKTMFINRFRKQNSNLQEIEAHLEKTFQPVEPRPAYVSSLKSRLLAAQADKASSPAWLKYSLWGLAGLVSSVVVVVAGVRAAILLLSALGVLRYAQDRAQQEPAPSVRTAI
jgi:anti-sigma-K factor RskA